MRANKIKSTNKRGVVTALPHPCIQDPSPTPPHKGEGLNLPHPLSRSSTFREERSGYSGLVPPPCGEGLG
ncbi:hypothetical protein ELI41_02930, partial [Rhizobium leguminosarum]